MNGATVISRRWLHVWLACYPQDIVTPEHLSFQATHSENNKEKQQAPLLHFAQGELICQRLRMLKLLRSSCVFQPLAHLVKRDCIDLTACIPLTEDV